MKTEGRDTAAIRLFCCFIKVAIIFCGVMYAGTLSGNMPIVCKDIKSTVRIAVIDNFEYVDVDIDNDGIPDISHGDVVYRFLEEGLPDAHIIKFNFDDFDEYGWFVMPPYRLENTLKKLISEIKSGIKYDALNLSFGIYQTYECEICPDSITPANIKDHVDSIRVCYVKCSFDVHYINRSVWLIEQLCAMGCQVYIGAGNKGDTEKERFNYLNLAKGAINVGALYEDGDKTDFSIDNSLINDWARGTSRVIKTQDGVDFTEDGTTDIPDSELSGSNDDAAIEQGVLINGLFGTSFAVPRAIIRDFNINMQMKQ